MSTVRSPRPPRPTGVYEFQTGRTYSPDGQTIRYTYAPLYNYTFFWDCDRGIYGRISGEVRGIRDLMQHYDDGHYDATAMPLPLNHLILAMGLSTLQRPIPIQCEQFWTGDRWTRPVFLGAWSWSDTFGKWGAEVLFAGKKELIYTYPKITIN